MYASTTIAHELLVSYEVQKYGVIYEASYKTRSPEYVVITSNIALESRDLVVAEIQKLLGELGQGRTDGTAYDTAWGARLAAYYPGHGFEEAIEWLRRNQREDGSWGAPLTHYHDRYISTLAAVIALTEVGTHPRDKRRVKRGENALWKLVGRLGRDDSDTVGFPILAAALGKEAEALGLDVPNAPIRYAIGYKNNAESLLQQPKRHWQNTTITFSFEALRHAAREEDEVLENNFSVSMSPSATAAYLMHKRSDAALSYLAEVRRQIGLGALPAVWPIDTFEIAWALSHLRTAGAVEPHDPHVRRVLSFLYEAWSHESGISMSSQWRVPDIDDTAACYSALYWGGYPVRLEVLDVYETEDHFACYPGETNPSLSAHVRLLSALRMQADDARTQDRIRKVVNVLYRLDENGSFWWDKWHASPYYVSSFALSALRGIADDLAHSRLKWIIRTQNDDGGWGYLGQSTAEETAYCLQALLQWDRNVYRLDASRLDAAAVFLQEHLNSPRFQPLWIGKSLYTPYYPVKAAILSALYEYVHRSD